MNKNALATILAIVLSSAAAHAADVPGSQDYPLLKRFEGSEIIGYKTFGYDQYTLMFSDSLGDVKNGKEQLVVGSVKRIVYAVPPGPTAVDVYNNLKQALFALKFQTLFESADSSAWLSYDIAQFLCQQGATGDQQCTAIDHDGANDAHYLTGKFTTQEGKDIYVALHVTQRNEDGAWGAPWRNPDMLQADPVAIKSGEVLVLLDVIEPAKLNCKMITIPIAK